MMKRELTLSPEPTTTIAELQQRVQDVCDSLSQNDIRHLYDSLHARIHASVAAFYRDMCVPFVLNLSYAPTCHINFRYNEHVLEGVAFFSGSIYLMRSFTNYLVIIITRLI